MGRWMVVIYSIGLVLSADSSAQDKQLYRYTDADGKIVYSDQPPPSSAKNVQAKRVTPNVIDTTESLVSQRASERFPVTLYTFDCGQPCQGAEALLNKRGVPLAGSSARNDDDRKVIELVFSQGVFGRPYVLPPGVPAERVAALRKAFIAALGDPGLRAEAGKMQLDVDPMAGDELQALIASIYATPRHLVERARLALIAKPQR